MLRAAMGSDRWHTVRQGECLATLAARYGFDDPDAIFGHAENGDLRQARPNRHVLRPGDRVYIPEPPGRAARCRAQVTNRFVGRRRRVRLFIQLRDAAGAPLANRRYQLAVAGETMEGQTGRDGEVDERVDALAQVGELRVYDAAGERALRVQRIAIGHLDPIDDEGGIAARLTNLGYPQMTSLAERVALFQTAEGLEPTGGIDDATRARIEERHRS